jgi:hypothetical protein
MVLRRAVRSSGVFAQVARRAYYARSRRERDPRAVTVGRDGDGDVEAARRCLKDREGCPLAAIGSWSAGTPDPVLIPGLRRWAEQYGLSAVTWTALTHKFDGTNAVPTADAVVAYLQTLTGPTRDLAEEYVRRAPRQIDTAYRRRIEAALDWTPLD